MLAHVRYCYLFNVVFFSLYTQNCKSKRIFVSKKRASCFPEVEREPEATSHVDRRARRHGRLAFTVRSARNKIDN